MLDDFGTIINALSI
ncbi:hypothetical protein AZE42_13057, partial [Rhizopogon vesiculosus]